MRNYLLSFHAVFFGYFLLMGLITSTESFLVSTEHKLSYFSVQPTSSIFLPSARRGSIDTVSSLSSLSTSSLSLSSSPSSTSTRPLYDGTNYTFPDTKTPAGVAEVLEVSFVHACMQLASGYVDILKMFIAASVGAYESGFSVDSIQYELTMTSTNTANRPLMDEEIKLRRDWFCVVYLTLSAMEHTSMMQSSSPSSLLAVDISKDSIPDDIKQRYGKLVEIVGEAYRNDKPSLSIEELTGDYFNNGDGLTLTQLEKAIILQSLKVATLTPIVVEESIEARGGGGGGGGGGNTTPAADVKPPTPPIEGAF
jgi:hypothetical protein